MRDANGLLEVFAEALRPPPRLSVAEHAEATMVLSEQSSAINGPLNLDHTPYLRFIMDCFSDNQIQKIVCCFGTQSAKTLLQSCLFNYIVDYSPGPTMLCYPSKSFASGISKSRWRPMFYEQENLKAHLTGVHDDMKIDEYRLDRMTIRYAWDSMNTVSGWPIKYLFKDETKSIDPEILEAADDRTKTFDGRKIVETSSPLHEKDNIWKALGLSRDYELEESIKGEDDKPGLRIPVIRWKEGDFTSAYFYYVPCPHCKHYQQLFPDRIRWPRNCAIRELTYKSYYLCDGCDGKITDNHKRQMLLDGEWRSNNEGNKTVGFHLNSLYSILGESTTFGEIAARYLRTFRTPERYKSFINGFLAIPWMEEEFGENAINVDTLIENAQGHDAAYMRNTIPAGVIMLTAGIDVHKDTIYYSCWGWTEDKEAYLIAWEIFDYDIEVNADEAAEFIERCKDTEFMGNEENLRIGAIAIDSGYRADVVYEFCRKFRWLVPIKGQRGDIKRVEGLEAYIIKTTRIDKTPKGTPLKGGILLRSINTGQIKAELYDGIAINKVHFPADVDQIFLTQLNSEKLVQRKTAKGGYEFYFTKKNKKSDGEKFETFKNHYLDTAVYARAVLEIMLGGKPIKGISSKYKAKSAVVVDKKATTPKRNERIRPRKGGGFINKY